MPVIRCVISVKGDWELARHWSSSTGGGQCWTTYNGSDLTVSRMCFTDTSVQTCGEGVDLHTDLFAWVCE